MNKEIIEVKTYYEEARVSSKNTPLKVAVLKVRYNDGTSDIIFRYLLNHKRMLSAINIEEYKTIDLTQIKQIYNLINKNDKKIFDLYLKKYLNNDLNIKTSTVKSALRLYIENKTTNMFKQIKLYNSRSVTNI